MRSAERSITLALILCLIMTAVTPVWGDACNFDVLEDMNKNARSHSTGMAPASQTTENKPEQSHLAQSGSSAGHPLQMIQETRTVDAVFGPSSIQDPGPTIISQVHHNLAAEITVADKQLAQSVHQMSTPQLEKEIQEWIDEQPADRPLPGLDDKAGFNQKNIKDLIHSYDPAAPRSTPLGNLVINVQSSVRSCRRFLSEPDKAYYEMTDSFDREQYWQDLRAAYDAWRSRSVAEYMLDELQERLNVGALTTH